MIYFRSKKKSILSKTYDLFFYLSFLSQTFTIYGTAREERDYLFDSSVPLPPTSQTFKHYSGDSYREYTPAHY